MYLLGSEISHSASPAHWQKTFNKRKLKWAYDLADISNEDEAKEFIESKEYVAINITTPWKRLAFECADEVDGASIFAGGCNFLVNKQGKLAGFNVDGVGCVCFLKSAGFEFAEKNVFVCGFGPTAKSVAYACRNEGADVTMLTRNPNESRISHCSHVGIALQGYDAELVNANLVVNATTLGMKKGDASPISKEKLCADCTYFDCIYGHGETAFINSVRHVGATCYDGAGMLESQADACEGILF